MSKSPLKNTRLPEPGGVGKRKRSRRSNQPKGSPRRARDKPRILQAVRDQNYQVHYQYGTKRRSHWFSNRELVRDKMAVFTRISSDGALFLTSQTQNEFIKLVAGHKSRKKGRVAERPGYIDGAYAFASGDFIKSDQKSTERLFATFEPDSRFEPNGTYREWERLISPFVVGQSSQLHRSQSRPASGRTMMFHAFNRLVVASLALSAAVVASGNNHARADGNDGAAISQSGKPPDAIIAPTDEATLKEFVARLKARYVGKPAGRVDN